MSILSSIFGSSQSAPITTSLPMQPVSQGLQPIRFQSAATAMSPSAAASPAEAAATSALPRAVMADAAASAGADSALPAANGNTGTVPPYLANPTYSGSPTIPGATSNILPGDTPTEVEAWQRQQAALAAQGMPTSGLGVGGLQQQTVPQRNVTNQQSLATNGNNLAYVPGVGLSLIGGLGTTGTTAGTAGVPTLTGVGTTGVASGLVAPPGYAQPTAAGSGTAGSSAATGSQPATQHVANSNDNTGTSLGYNDGSLLGSYGAYGGYGLPGAYTGAQGWGLPTWSGAPAGTSYGSYGFAPQAATAAAINGANQSTGGSWLSRLFGL